MVKYLIYLVVIVFSFNNLCIAQSNDIQLMDYYSFESPEEILYGGSTVSTFYPSFITFMIPETNYIFEISFNFELTNTDIAVLFSNDNSLLTWDKLYSKDLTNVIDEETGEFAVIDEEVTITVNDYYKYIQIECGSAFGGIGTVTLSDLQAVFGNEIKKYSYDEAGNRIKREYILTTSTKSTSSNAELEPEEFEFDENTAILVFPNPTAGVLNIEVKNNNESETSITAKVFSLSGQNILRQQSNNTSFDIDISNQPDGTYLLNLLINGKSKNFTIIKR